MMYEGHGKKGKPRPAVKLPLLFKWQAAFQFCSSESFLVKLGVLPSWFAPFSRQASCPPLPADWSSPRVLLACQVAAGGYRLPQTQETPPGGGYTPISQRTTWVETKSSADTGRQQRPILRMKKLLLQNDWQKENKTNSRSDTWQRIYSHFCRRRGILKQKVWVCWSTTKLTAKLLFGKKRRRKVLCKDDEKGLKHRRLVMTKANVWRHH